MATVEINPLEIVEGLEEKCWQCQGCLHPDAITARGGKWLGDENDPVICGICHGKGYRLTEAGDAMLAFLERWKG